MLHTTACITTVLKEDVLSTSSTTSDLLNGVPTSKLHTVLSQQTSFNNLLPTTSIGPRIE
uniref:SJCHGC08276 protein n=1 Tax=Schistosoma japonicum TaxID=6182 RepID=Q5BRH5_SCHJA|nr:SJCHGC08276 protein [Schistosoma japonicum]